MTNEELVKLENLIDAAISKITVDGKSQNVVFGEVYTTIRSLTLPLVGQEKYAGMHKYFSTRAKNIRHTDYIKKIVETINERFFVYSDCDKLNIHIAIMKAKLNEAKDINAFSTMVVEKMNDILTIMSGESNG